MVVVLVVLVLVVGWRTVRVPPSTLKWRPLRPCLIGDKGVRSRGSRGGEGAVLLPLLGRGLLLVALWSVVLLLGSPPPPPSLLVLVEVEVVVLVVPVRRWWCKWIGGNLEDILLFGNC